MKLLICTTEYFPNGAGIANVTYNIVEKLKDLGIECTVCSPTGPDIKLGNDSLIQKTGIVGLLYYWYSVSRYFKNNDYDVVWLQNPFILTDNPFKRCLVTMHSTYYGSSIYGVGNLPFNLYKSVVAHSERYCLTRMHPNTFFTGVGIPVCEELEKIGIARDRITHIPNGVDTRLFHPSPDKISLRNKFKIPENDIILLSVGRLTHQKQPHIVIEVFSRLQKEIGDVTLCIAGKGELLEETKGLAKKKGLHKVLFLGYVDDQDLPDLYACADYYIMASNYEGGMPPLTLAEAMASSLPCIVSDIPQLRIVKMAECGIMVNFEDTAEQFSKIREYISSDNESHSINAREFAKENLDWKSIAEQYHKEFLRMTDLKD
ncbi:glycosyltransferase involved in cell wall biosynthesis [Methanocalculus alkaliphilus]|uniref:glycosyltransferase family 4 protein n=1 Tax=Methanocalculus alkaliphilus TaxID=768730 RepID=UPI0020A12896|nr:glycosyltransferase family 4 protein [Methanocalculus alkaliphilus]MCP1716118.1 glycosyltransferase involved in cell wall biosynthesis [Methanocalculus alkaliphilus]